MDSAVTLAACISHFKWKPDDLDLLAAGSLVGHLLECVRKLQEVTSLIGSRSRRLRKHRLSSGKNQSGWNSRISKPNKSEV